MVKMLSLAFLILYSTGVKCQNWCELVKPKGTYNGLGIYHRYLNNGKDEYVMFNRDGPEWKFNVNLTNGAVTLKMIDNSVVNGGSNGVRNKFATYGKKTNHNCVCNVDPLTVHDRLHCKCETSIATYYLDHRLRKSVILKGQPSDPDAEYVMVFSKNNRTDYFVFNPYENKNTTCSPNTCKVPPFVSQMDENMFQRIEGIVDIVGKTTQESGYLVLLNEGEPSNADHRPLYCFTFENEDISEECKSLDKMELLFKECFGLGTTSSGVITSLASEPDTEPDTGTEPGTEPSTEPGTEPGTELVTSSKDDNITQTKNGTTKVLPSRKPKTPSVTAAPISSWWVTPLFIVIAIVISILLVIGIYIVEKTDGKAPPPEKSSGAPPSPPPPPPPSSPPSPAPPVASEKSATEDTQAKPISSKLSVMRSTEKVGPTKLGESSANPPTNALPKNPET